MSEYKTWKQEEILFITENYEKIKDKELAEKLSIITGENITISMIRRQRRKLKLCKKRGRPFKKKHPQVDSLGNTI
jgi:hypothetical protein